MSYPTAGVRRLRPAVFRRLLASMPARKPSISLSAIIGEKGPQPEFGTADFSELRNVPRLFPAGAGERECFQYLLEQMQATPDRPRGTKAEFKETCRRRFHVTVESFEYCWREANKVTGARWHQPGRRPR